MRLFLLCTVWLLGCGGSDEADAACKRPTGIWKATYSTISGDCGAIPAGLGVLGDTAETDAKCERVQRKWATDNCSVEIEITGCPSETANGVPTKVDIVAAIQRETAAEWSGEFDVTVIASDGRSCRGLYDLLLADK